MSDMKKKGEREIYRVLYGIIIGMRKSPLGRRIVACKKKQTK
jgi:hypothetical protein